MEEYIQYKFQFFGQHDRTYNIIGIIGSLVTNNWKIHHEGKLFQSLVTEEPMNRNHIHYPLITILDEFSIIHT